MPGFDGSIRALAIALGIDRFLNISRAKLFQFAKYVVYALLTLNVFLFFSEEWAAAPHRFADGISLADVIEGFAATIDTAAWVVLLLMFELETYQLADHHFTSRVTLALHSLRTICYGFIVYAFYGYVTKLTFLLGMTAAPNITDVCSLASVQWSYAIDLDEYQLINAANCGSFSAGIVFYQFPEMHAIVDQVGRTAIIRLAWVDVINAAVWLMVVLLLEIDVRLQERDLLKGNALKISSSSKYVLYSLLFLAAAYWGWKGDFVDFWDAFLWLVAFVFIELNVFDWRLETLQQQAEGAA